ncbi:hypothetical protein JGU71_16400 [Antrihabitans sp. YC3-6]|uniref:Uncharacterized protein n=1 Tax=Antrihabitans stalagmiti TaxID=2799499 RepID=A0A934U557_9NOCA|nr:hypothetical protein [Antrihabitans stalagmiti]MBJ8340473.1 hypothetical protein [Antrihabitans stalagmiti]
MTVAEFLSKLVRRPLAGAVLILLAIAAAAYGWTSTTAKYESTAAVVVIPPGSGDADAGLNPFINLNNNMAQLAVILGSAAQSSAARQSVEDAGATADYTVDTVAGDSSSFSQLSPQLVIVTHGPDPESSRRGAVALIDFTRARLEKIQLDAAVPPRNNALLITTTDPLQGEVVATSPIRSAGAYFGAALIAGILFLLILEVTLEWLRDRRSRAGDASADETRPATSTRTAADSRAE